MIMSKKLRIGLQVCLLLSPMGRLSATHESAKEKEANPMIEHVSDSHVWHFGTYKGRHISLHLPVILYKKGTGLYLFSSKKLWDSHHHPTVYRGFTASPHGEKITSVDGAAVYDLSITKNIANIMLSILILLLFFIGMAGYYRRRSILNPPKGMWAVMTSLISFVRDHIAKDNIGEKHYERFTPYLLTIFCFIWLNNTLGLLPGAGNVTGNISATFVLACFTFLITNLNGTRDYWGHIFSPPGVPKWMLPIMIPTEILGLFTKNIALMMRLFANMLAGHLVLLSIISIMFIVQPIFASIIVVPIGTFMIFIKLGAAFFQAYLFTLLTAISIGGAVASHEAHHPAADNPLKPINPLNTQQL